MFAYVALVVGAFIIFNTFSITVAQRTREFGLLRTLGASRRQIMRAVVGEGLLLGVVGAVLGLFAGIGLAPALDQLFKLFGADLPDSGTVLETRTIVVSLLVGIVITVLAGLPPALRATRVPPIAAMREGVEIPHAAADATRAGRPLRCSGSSSWWCLGLVIGGASLPVLVIVWGLRSARLWARLRRGEERPERNYRVVPALARVIGAARHLARHHRASGARELDSPARAHDGHGGRADRRARAGRVRGGARRRLQGDDRSVGQPLVRGQPDRRELAVEQRTADTRGRGDGRGEGPRRCHRHAGRLHARSRARHQEQRQDHRDTIRRRSSASTASNGTKARRARCSSLGTTGTVVTKEYAKEHHLKVGQTLSVLTPSNRRVSLTVLGTVDEKSGVLQDLTISLPLAGTAFGQREDALDFVAYAPGATDAQVQPAVDRLLASQFPQARSRTAEQFKQDLSKQINTLLALIYVLLALSVIVSLFGIVNTLILSIYERTRELGMMRAIGTSRRQVRQMIRYESIITALIGGVFGLIIGVVGALLVVALTLSGAGYVISIPVGTLVVLLVVAGSPACSPRSCRPGARRAWTCCRRSAASSAASP